MVMSEDLQTSVANNAGGRGSPRSAGSVAYYTVRKRTIAAAASINIPINAIRGEALAVRGSSVRAVRARASVPTWVGREPSVI